MSLASAALRNRHFHIGHCNSAAASTNIIINEDLIADPRPDLVEDSILWATFLKHAVQLNFEVYGVLHGFRCMGSRLKHNSKGDLVIRPDIDPTGNRAWKTQQEYDQAKERYLIPHQTEIKRLLDKLGDEFDETPPG